MKIFKLIFILTQLSGMHEVGGVKIKIHEHESDCKTCCVGDMVIVKWHVNGQVIVACSF